MEISPESHGLSSPTRKYLHRRSPSPESEPKRRKHHHRHHSHRHHRHRHRSRKEGKEENPDGGDNKIRDDRNQAAEDGEIEEGEILEEGEIVSDHEIGYLVAPDKNHNYMDVEAETKLFDHHQDSVSLETLPNHCEIPSKKIEAVPRFGVDDKTEEKSSVNVAEIDVLNEVHTKRKQSRVDAAADDDGDVKTQIRSETPFSRDSADALKNKAWEEDIEFTSDHSRRRKKHSEMNQRDRSRSREIDYDRRNHSSKSEIDKHKHVKHGLRKDKYDDHIRENGKHRAVHRERERSVSHSRHDRQELKHSNNDRDIDKVREYRKERDRSSSISSRKDYDTRRMERDGVRHRDMERPRDMSRDRYRERDMSRRGRDKDSYDRDSGRSRDWDRVNVRHRDRDNQDMQKDSRHPKYNEFDGQRERMRSNEIPSATDDLERKHEVLREEDEDYQEKIEHQLANQEEEELERIREESRKRKQAILEKYKQQQLQHAPPISPAVNEESTLGGTKENLDAKHDTSNMEQDFLNGYAIDPSFTVEKSSIDNVALIHGKESGVGGLGEGSPKSERSADMFCDDIFGESPVGIRKTGKTDALQIEKSGLHDNWDDADGYYSYRFGEILDGRYEVIAAHGKGVFSTVVRAKDLKYAPGEPEEVAIKIIRNNETMYKAGQEELKILGKLAATDPEDKRHCVRFLSTFKYRNHLCLVFESLHMNLREVLKKFGRNIGLKLTAVRTYAKQLFIALKHLRNCGVLHCDIKPDNMLVNEGKNILKLCDFGNAMSTGKNEPTPYLVSRFYRAPEIILGLEYDHPLDMWSVGCCLYELYCGKVLFPGPSNNDMLRLHIELKGSFPKKMLRKALFTSQHFDQDLNFLATEEDPVTRKPIRRLLLNIKPKDISTLISSSPGEDPKMTAHFKDLLERIFVLDPEKRITVSQALSHPFITGK